MEVDDTKLPIDGERGLDLSEGRANVGKHPIGFERVARGRDGKRVRGSCAEDSLRISSEVPAPHLLVAALER